MADLKKKKKKKDTSGSPNLALVIFLIFFILATIVLGIFTYSGFSGQEEMKTELKDAKEQAELQKKMSYLYKMLYQDTRIALGDETLTKEDWEESGPDREAFLDGKFVVGKKDDAKKKKIDEDAKKLIERLKKELEGGAGKERYASNMYARIDAARKRADEAEARLGAAEAKIKRYEDLSQTLLNDQKLANDKAYKQIVKAGNEALAAVSDKSDSFTKLANDLAIAKKEKADDFLKYEAIKGDLEESLRLKDKKIRDILAEAKENAAVKELGGGVAVRNAGEMAPLILDINMGKPLWDYPVGKIVRVDLEVRQVAINLGSKHGVKPELTFNIFGPGPTGRAEKQMKGTIEVVKVLDTATSLCRITSLYDSEGKEILMNLDTRTRLSRETEAPIREGDLLFNMFFGTRVAVVGYVSITGEPSDNPAEQIRQMEDFMYLLNRNGMLVDSFVDPRDGQIKGNLSGRTRYVIQGSLLSAPAEKAPPKVEGDDKEAPKVKEGLANGERIELLNKSTMALRKDAIDRGLLLISADNFAHMIGYRKVRSANTFEFSTFNPRLPFSGAWEDQPRRRAEPKMDMDKKDMEKKDDKGM